MEPAFTIFYSLNYVMMNFNIPSYHIVGTSVKLYWLLFLLLCKELQIVVVRTLVREMCILDLGVWCKCRIRNAIR